MTKTETSYSFEQFSVLWMQ